MYNSEEMLELKYDEMIRETELAWLLRFGDDEAWLPKSLCENDCENYVISVPGWMVKKKELDMYLND